jgi:hypothetical protein
VGTVGPVSVPAGDIFSIFSSISSGSSLVAIFNFTWNECICLDCVTFGVTAGQLFSANSAYAYVYNTTVETLDPCTVPPTATQLISFVSSGPSDNITFNGTNTLTLNVTGDYVADYSVTASAATGSGLSFALYDTPSGGVATLIPGSPYFILSPSGTVNGRVKFTANAGDQIQLANNTESPVTLATSPSSIVIGNHASIQTGTTTVTTLSSPPITVLAGSSIYIGIATTETTTAPTVTDNQGHTFTLIASSSHLVNVLTAVLFIDNVLANTNYIVTAAFPAVTEAVLQVIELRGTATPSFDTTSSNSQFPVASNTGTTGTATSTTSGELALMFSAWNPSPNGEFTTAVAPNFNIENPVSPLGQGVAEGSVGQYLGASGTYLMTANITGAPAPVPWQTDTVTVFPAVAMPFCQTPVNASLDLILLRAK